MRPRSRVLCGPYGARAEVRACAGDCRWPTTTRAPSLCEELPRAEGARTGVTVTPWARPRGVKNGEQGEAAHGRTVTPRACPRV